MSMNLFVVKVRLLGLTYYLADDSVVSPLIPCSNSTSVPEHARRLYTRQAARATIENYIADYMQLQGVLDVKLSDFEVVAVPMECKVGGHIQI